MKKEKQPSATAMLRKEIPLILKKHPEGLSFEELWNFLYEDKNLAKIMQNKEKKPRFGLLQGICNRIKGGKEPCLMMQKIDATTRYFYYNNSLDRINKLTNNYISSVNNIDINKSDIPKEKQKVLDDIYQNLISLQFLTKKLEDLKSVTKSEIEKSQNKPKTKPKIKETATKK